MAEVSNKVEMFNKEINYIKDEKIKESAKVLIEKVPDYFFTEAASSTGKYHPEFSQGLGGLLRHTKAAVRIAYEILNTETFGNFYTSEEKDLIVLALILHDSIKRGDNERYTRIDHPLLACKFIEENKDKTSLNKKQVDLLVSMISSHMGEWNKDYDGNEILPKPETKYQRIVHLCDLLSSKKFLDVKFDKDNNIIY